MMSTIKPETQRRLLGAIPLAGLLGLLIWAGIELFHVAGGTGQLLGYFDKIWGPIFISFILSSIFILAIIAILIYKPGLFRGLWIPVARLRDHLGWFSWLLSLAIVFAPAYLLNYTSHSYDFDGLGFRIYLFFVSVGISALLTSRGEDTLISWRGTFKSIVLFGTIFLMSRAMVTVTEFPLSLSWSEGNRIYDYSVLFGRYLYDYPATASLEAYIDRGRQALWGLPFLIPGVQIEHIRLWSAIVYTIPYALFGWMVFRPGEERNYRPWFWAGLWTMLFLNQGPIYTPLVLSAILVAAMRRVPIWIGLPLVGLAGYYAQTSRLTWMVAPAIWAGMVALFDYADENGKLSVSAWGKTLVFGLVGLIGGFGFTRGFARLGRYFGQIAGNNTTAPAEDFLVPVPSDIGGTVSVELPTSSGIGSAVTDQALLWSRLWPNPTYGLGIILGLVLAVGPLIALLFALRLRKKWDLNTWQTLGVGLPLLVFLGVGVLISVKIGGGSNLHNVDMFLIACVFAAALAWDHGGLDFIRDIDSRPLHMKLLLAAVLVVPAFHPVIDAAPLELPPQDKTDWTLELLNAETARIQGEGGEILYMDQRQLLTFHQVPVIPLVNDYEKKLVMDKAMSGDRDYFEDFYRDIIDQRFDLIVTDPQRIRFSDEDESFGEENDVWVSWVTGPLLCYYEPKYTIKLTGVWLMVPRDVIDDPCPYLTTIDS